MLFLPSYGDGSLYLSALFEPWAFFLLQQTTTIGIMMIARRTGAPTPTAIPMIAPYPNPDDEEDVVFTEDPPPPLPPPPLSLIT